MLTSGGTGSLPCSSGSRRHSLAPTVTASCFRGAGKTALFRGQPPHWPPHFWRAPPNQSHGRQGRFLQRELTGAPGGSSRLRLSVKVVVPPRPTLPSALSSPCTHGPPPARGTASPPPVSALGEEGLHQGPGLPSEGRAGLRRAGRGAREEGKKAKIKYECDMQSRRGSRARV